MSAHTAGPWFRIPGRSAVWSDDRKTAIICGMHHNADNYEADANLIAAAPDLLAALEDVMRRAYASDAWWIHCPDKGGFDTEMIEAAIAKAKGES